MLLLQISEDQKDLDDAVEDAVLAACGAPDTAGKTFLRLYYRMLQRSCGKGRAAVVACLENVVQAMEANRELEEGAAAGDAGQGVEHAAVEVLELCIQHQVRGRRWLW